VLITLFHKTTLLGLGVRHRYPEPSQDRLG
jgi:hypothetical protein